MRVVVFFFLLCYADYISKELIPKTQKGMFK